MRAPRPWLGMAQRLVYLSLLLHVLLSISMRSMATESVVPDAEITMDVGQDTSIGGSGLATDSQPEASERGLPFSSTTNDGVVTGAFKITFHNERRFPVHVFWYNPNGHEVEQGSLEPDQAKDFNTFANHIFVFRDDKGMVLRTVVANENMKEVSTEDVTLKDPTKVALAGRFDTLNLAYGEREVPVLPAQLQGPLVTAHNRTKARPVVFTNRDLSHIVQLFWVSPEGEERPQGQINPGDDITLNTYTGHRFRFRRNDGLLMNDITLTDQSNQVQSALVHETEFHREYERMNRRPWINVWPRPEPSYKHLPILPVGESMTISSSSAHWKGDMSQLKGAAQYKPMNITIKSVSTNPPIYIIEDFLSSEECDHIIETAVQSGGMYRSTLGASANVDNTRTSENTWISFEKTKIFSHIYRRGFETVGIPFSEGNTTKIAESMQVLRYQYNQGYNPHHDYFPPLKDLGNLEVQRGHNRFATLFLYLSDVDEGGETMFPRHGGIRHYHPCADGFKVKPKKGRAALFYSMLPDGNLDFNSEHGSCPVKKGTKWGANWWFWDAVRSINTVPSL